MKKHIYEKLYNLIFKIEKKFNYDTWTKFKYLGMDGQLSKIISIAKIKYYNKFINNKANIKLSNQDYITYNTINNKQILDIQFNVLKKMYLDNNSSYLLYPNNSISILVSLMYLKYKKNIDKIYIIGPAYFIVYRYCMLLNIKCIDIKLLYDNYHNIPFNKLNKIKNSCLWITVPIIFSNETYTTHDITQLIKNINDNNNFAIIDESLALNHAKILGNYIKKLNKYIFIESPYKNISINGFLKISFLISSKKNINILNNNYFKHLINVFSSNFLHLTKLNKSLEYYISPYYDNCYNFILKMIEKNFNFIKNEIICNYKNVYITADSQINSQFVLVYLKTLKKIQECKMEKILYDIIINTYCIIEFHEFSTSDLIVFRVNLIHDQEYIIKNLTAVLNFFKDTLMLI